MSKISLKNIQKRYGETTVIDNLNLEILPGERMILLGPSGCGKSTILRMIAGLEEISDGTLTLGETEVTHIPSGKRNVSMVFQNYALYPHMSVEKNITYALQRNGVPKAEREERLEEVLEMLELHKYRKRVPKDLSGGQRQRVALARAAVKRSDFFLLDEPLSNLDAKLRVKARREILKLHQTYNQTLVYVTHDQVEAMALGDRITVLRDGEIQMCDTPHNVYYHPTNIFTARFIGSPPMNVMLGSIENSQLVLGYTSLDFSAFKHDVTPYEGKKIYFGVRPEHMEIVPKAQANLIGKLQYIENFGGEIAHTLKIGDEEVIVMAEIEHTEDEIGIKIDMSRAHLFEYDSETNIRYLRDEK